MYVHTLINVSGCIYKCKFLIFVLIHTYFNNYTCIIHTLYLHLCK